ncbi:MAG TPA: hypothetical protein VNN62_06985 [Methylomirabilota bacterium]|jgi:hypothetical protein|nr:hypothetical protein [Methylomirabilota bacterium]
MTKTLAGLLVVLFLTCSLRASAEMPDRAKETLRDLPGVTVVIEPLQAAAEHDGLTQHQLQIDVEQQLRTAGIRVLTHDEWRQTPGSPYLYVNVAALKKNYGLYAYSIEVCLNQVVTLLRNQHIQEFAETWETREVGTVGQDRLSTVRESVAAHVNTFIRDYRAVNPSSVTVRKHPSGDV